LKNYPSPTKMWPLFYMCDTTNISFNIYYITKTIFVNFLQEFLQKIKTLLNSLIKELNKV
ncbi:hypothetical protein, partial [Borreliella valaisiana]|uniref:hypothetical protein n=1 Tax=Borreliella valaisiana TaxID=62088 RepID=UPI001B3537CF